MIPPRLRAGLVIGAVVVASGIAGAAIDRAVVTHRSPRIVRAPAMGGGNGGGRRPTPDQFEQRRRTEMLDKLTKELTLTSSQRAGLDSIFQRTDSSLRAIRRATQPQIEQIFEQSHRDVYARLDSTQRAKFDAMRSKRSREYRGGRGGADQRPSMPHQ